MLKNIPLMIIPFILYNLGGLGLVGKDWPAPLQSQVVDLSMVSGAVWTMSLGDVLIVIGLAMLFIEILKSTRAGSTTVLDHVFSTILFIAFLVEFLLVPSAATQVFFILMVIAFIDVVAGFSVSIRSAGRDVSIGL